MGKHNRVWDSQLGLSAFMVLMALSWIALPILALSLDTIPAWLAWSIVIWGPGEFVILWVWGAHLSTIGHAETQRRITTRFFGYSQPHPARGASTAQPD